MSNFFFVISGQNYEKEVKIKVEGDRVNMLVSENPLVTLSGEAAIKIGHALIGAGEKVLKDEISEE